MSLLHFSLDRFAGLFSILILTCCGHAAAARERPNFVVILVDNVGYGDLGCYGNRHVQTPNIDRLALQGVRCTDFYVASPSCMPSRAALLTGRHPLRNGLNEQLWREPSEEQIGLRHSEMLLPQFLAQANYRSACIGKWNIGFAPGSRPTERGFDEFFGHASGNIHYYHHVYNLKPDMYRGIEPVQVDGYATDLFADASCKFIRENKQRPFFLYVAFNAAHFPNRRNHRQGDPLIWQAPARSFERYGWTLDESDPTRRYQAVLSALDDGIGQILNELEEQSLSRETIVVFLSDNGAFMLPERGLEVASNRPLRDGGVTLWEGGIRVPCCFRWPEIIPGGTECREPLSSLDLFPMLLSAAGVPLPSDRRVDGHNPLATLQGMEASPHPFLPFQWRGASALRKGKMKIVRRNDQAAWELYDLEQDLAEQNDLATQRAAEVNELATLYEQWRATTRE